MSVYQDEITKIFKHLILKYETNVTQVKDKSLKLDRLSMIEISLLEYLQDHEKVTQHELIESLEFKRSKTTATVQKFLKAGFINKEINPEDKRSIWVTLSPLGLSLLETYQRHEHEFIDFILKDMTVNEEKAIVKFLSKINQSINLK
jgi:DNA-binding MarR family transcriptional regulator